MFPFIEYIKSFIQVSKALEDDILNLLKFETVAKGDTIIKGGRVNTRMYFLEQGTCRSFFNKDNKEITYWIYPQNNVVTTWNSFINQTIATESFEAIETCKLCSLTYDQWNSLMQKHSEFETFYRILLEGQIAGIDEFYKGYFFMTAKEKYDLLITAFPNVTQIANLKHIASMLGVSQETLSRIRGLK